MGNILVYSYICDFMLHEDIYIQIFAEFVLIAELVIFCMIGLIWYFADQKQWQNHQKTVEYTLLAQTVLVTIMSVRLITSTYARQFFLHALFGIFVYLLLLYVYLLMRNKLPQSISVPKRFRKNLMQMVAILWGITVIIGLLSFMFIPEELK